MIGNGLILPSGPLRENLSSLKRANIIIINGKKNISKDLLRLNKLYRTRAITKKEFEKAKSKILNN